VTVNSRGASPLRLNRSLCRTSRLADFVALRLPVVQCTEFAGAV